MTSGKKWNIPGNVNNFRPKILGMDAKYAVTLILSLSLAAFLSRFSLIISLFILACSLFFLLPVQAGRTLAVIVGDYIGWRFSTLIGRFDQNAKALDINGISFITDSRRIGLVAKVETGNYSSLSEPGKDTFIRSISRVLNGMHCSLSLLSLPVSADYSKYHAKGDSKLVENYNFLVDYLFDRQYFFETYLILWLPSYGNRDKVSNELLDSMNYLKTGLEGIVRSVKLLAEKGQVESILEKLQ